MSDLDLPEIVMEEVTPLEERERTWGGHARVSSSQMSLNEEPQQNDHHTNGVTNNSTPTADNGVGLCYREEEEKESGEYMTSQSSVRRRNRVVASSNDKEKTYRDELEETDEEEGDLEAVLGAAFSDPSTSVSLPHPHRPHPHRPHGHRRQPSDDSSIDSSRGGGPLRSPDPPRRFTPVPLSRVPQSQPHIFKERRSNRSPVLVHARSFSSLTETKRASPSSPPPHSSATHTDEPQVVADEETRMFARMLANPMLKVKAGTRSFKDVAKHVLRTIRIKNAFSVKGADYSCPLLSKDGKIIAKRSKHERFRLSDWFHTLLKADWLYVLFFIFFVFFFSFLSFVALYWLGSAGEEACLIDTATGEELEFPATLWFSMQTQSAVGYGRFVAESNFCHFISSLQAIFGIVILSVTAGVVFTKISIPSMRVVFSDRCVVDTRQNHLHFRLYNSRDNKLFECRIYARLEYSETTDVGHSRRRIEPVEFTHNTNVFPVLSVGLDVYHTIDETSPFFHRSRQWLSDSKAILRVAIVGLDDDYAATVGAYHHYVAGDILIGHRFKDTYFPQMDGSLLIDYTDFHETERI